MATRRYSVPPAGTLQQVVEAVGSATATAAIELTVDLAATIVNDSGSTRKVTRSEVLQAIEALEEYIMQSNWPPV